MDLVLNNHNLLNVSMNFISLLRVVVSLSVDVQVRCLQSKKFLVD